MKDYKDSEAYLKQKYGERGWMTARGSAGISAPIYWSVSASDGSMYKIVYATGTDENFPQ